MCIVGAVFFCGCQLAMAVRSVSRSYPSCLMPSLGEQVLLHLSAVIKLVISRVSVRLLLFSKVKTRSTMLDSSPEALFSNDQWAQLMLQPPLCN